MRPKGGGPLDSPAAPPKPPRLLRSVVVALAALGPGILGLLADNDAGGMMSYLLTGAQHELRLFIPALLAMGAATVFIQDMALRLALATRLPFQRLVRDRFGSGAAQLQALLLHALNVIVLATEVSGMALALQWAGIPFIPAVGVAVAATAAIAMRSHYQSLERLLLVVGVLNLAFIAALFSLPTGHGVESPWQMGPPATDTNFLLLALAGNAVAPWMVYWQENAVVARGMKVWELRRGRFDLLAGVLVQMAMATVVLWIGASLRGSPGQVFNPLQWMGAHAGARVADLFAVGLFDAGLLAAVTIGFSSSWMVTEAFPAEPATQRRRRSALQAGSLMAAAALVVLPGWPQGFLALFAQALAALLMPITLVFLGTLTSDGPLMGRIANQTWQRLVGVALTALFLALAAAAWL